MTTLITTPDTFPVTFYAPTPKAKRRVAEFFTTQINNDHTRKAYLIAARRFSAWCDAKGLPELSAVEPIHIAAFVKEAERELSPPTVKQHLAALRMLFDWLVTGHIIETNPAHAVRGPKHIVRKAKRRCWRRKRSGSCWTPSNRIHSWACATGR